ncbi:hypothetical protein MA16_Dca004094 [Dendrobium catenatum]|uniref:Uncharacterized protein n=1 Tax=Dendrobium catenatum TaxID=906689 RepID=A0A2I0X2F3_9ASPA|nr:hypothetical protein MA16_Dca004094 [Dendrobium catenatum]
MPLQKNYNRPLISHKRDPKQGEEEKKKRRREEKDRREQLLLDHRRSSSRRLSNVGILPDARNGLQASLATADKGNNLDVEEALERIAEEPSAALHDRQDAAESITEGINNLCVSLSKETLETSKTGECSGADIDKRIRALKKKIRLAEGQQLKGEQSNMKPEQIEKMAKIADWHAELKLLEDKRTNQAS